MADGHIILDTRVDTKGVDKGFKSITAAGKKVMGSVAKIGVAAAGASAVAVGALTKKSVEAFGEWEQLVGGVETLYKNSSQKVIQYANEAYKTTGLSANEYMKNVTAFSASLLQSLGNDTNAAADVSDMAMRDIADNVNKMGSSYESVQLAYQGFAKQQYMLLDNLKLGYGGTKTEMERLLKDAQKLTGVKYDINNLADVYSAIHAIQENLGITGTTAKEASTTIQGSAAMMKAAYENVLTAMGGGGDIETAVDNLIQSLGTYIENIMPVVERSLIGLGEVIARVAPELVQTLTTAIIKSLPALLEAVVQMVIGAVKGVIQGIKDLLSGKTIKAVEDTTKASNKAAQSTVKNMKKTAKAAKDTKKQLDGQLAAFDEVKQATKEQAQTQEEQAQAPAATEQFTGKSDAEIENTQKKSNEWLANFGAKLKTTFAPVGEYLKTTFTPAFEQIGKTGVNVWNRIKKSAVLVGSDFAQNIAPRIGSVFTNDIIPILADTMEQGARLFDTISGSAHRTFDKIYTEAVSPFAQQFTDIWGDMWDTTKELWDERSGSIFDGLNEWVLDLEDLFNKIWDNTIKPIVDNVKDAIDWLWEKHLKKLFTHLQEFFYSLADMALAFWHNVLFPVYDWIAKKIGPVVAWVVNLIVNIVGTLVGVISDVIDGIIEALTGVLDFLTGVFTGDWKKAWSGIKKFFKGIWDGLYGIVKGAINLIVDGLNALWKGIYKVFKGIANGLGKAVGWVGDLFGKDWEFKMPEKPPLIPKLARGAVLPANKPFLAQLGDQKNGRNLETPESLLREIYSEQNQPMINLLAQMLEEIKKGHVMQADGREIARVVRSGEKKLGSYNGGLVFG